eukprot:g41588.t1
MKLDSGSSCNLQQCGPVTWVIELGRSRLITQSLPAQLGWRGVWLGVGIGVPPEPDPGPHSSEAADPLTLICNRIANVTALNDSERFQGVVCPRRTLELNPSFLNIPSDRGFHGNKISPRLSFACPKPLNFVISLIKYMNSDSTSTMHVHARVL